MSVTVQDIVDLINAKLGSHADHNLDANSSLRDIGLSSLQTADIVFTIEDRLGIEFDAGRAADIATIGDLVELANSTALTETQS
ncbi:acyl carrier protein [Micromonospora arborensis]|uniref:acyl carrier protein n=1 Tax=Micromonospora arborensis TaxID=2116518 RepID=UPI0033C22231